MKHSRSKILLFCMGVFTGLHLLAAWQVYKAPLRPALLLGGFTLLGLLSLVGLAWLVRQTTWQEKLLSRMDTWKTPIAWLALTGLLSAWLANGLSAEAQAGWPLALRPAFGWLAGQSLLVLLALAALAPQKTEKQPILKNSLAVFGLLVLVAGFMALSRLGLERVGYYWYAPGTPLLIGQVGIALSAGAGLSVWLGSKMGQKFSTARLDTALFIGLFLLTAALWLSEPPGRPVNFLPAAMPPNYEIYPDSDSAYIDINAQRLLAGQPFSVDPADKPTYSYFVYLLHLLAGQDFATLLNLQAAVLALIAPLFYLLFAIGFDNRPAGLAAGILFSLRELNSIRLSNVILVSHPKLLLSDVPSAGLMILLALLLLGWLRAPRQRLTWPLWAGIVFAALLLLRTQVIVLAPLVALGAWFILRHQPRRLLGQAALLAALGFGAFSLPWALYGLNAPASANASAYSRQLAIQFQFDPLNHNVRPLAGESEAEFNARMREQVLTFVRENPGYTLKAISAYFFRNLAQGFLFLPASLRLEINPAAYTSRLPYWHNWFGGLPSESWAPLTLNLFLIASGLAQAWRKFRWIGLFPLLLYLGYLTSLALPMISGWRFLLPADWIVLTYYLLGVTALADFLADRFGLTKTLQPTENVLTAETRPAWRRAFAGLALACCFSASLFVAQSLTPNRSPALTEAERLEAYLSASQGHPEAPNPEAVRAFLSQPGAGLRYGRALYPRFFEAGEGFSRNGLISFRPYEFARLGFYLLGPQSEHVILPLTASPERFPHAAEVWVLGCRRQEEFFHRAYLEAIMVLLPGENLVVWQEPHPDDLSAGCQK